MKFSCLYLFPSSHKVVPQKASGRVGGGGGGGCCRGGGGSYTTRPIYRGGNIYRGQYIGVATFSFFEPWLKLDEKSIENGLEVQIFLVVCLFSFWGSCHHSN